MPRSGLGLRGVVVRAVMVSSLASGALSRALPARAEPLEAGEPPAQAPPNDPEQRSLELRAAANQAYVEGHYDEARHLLEQANALAPYALHSFNLAAIEHRLGHCEHARDLFESYLRADPSGPGERDAREALQELYEQCGRGSLLPASPRLLERAQDARLSDQSAAPARAALPAAPPAFRVYPADPGLSSRDIAGWSLLGMGGAAALAAAASAILMHRAESDLEALAARDGSIWNAAEARSLDANGSRYQTLSLVCGFGSMLLMGTGVSLLLLERADAEADAAGAAVLYQGRF